MLRVLASGTTFVGVLEIASSGGAIDCVLETVGRPVDDAVVFEGTRGPSPADESSYELRRLTVRLDPSSGLSGDIDLVATGVDRRQLTGELLSASHQPLRPASPAAAAGTWSGRAIVRQCTGDCPSYRTVGTGTRLALVLGESGGQITGQLQLVDVFECFSCWLPVKGSASSASLSLTSDLVTRTHPVGDRTLHLQRFDATIDGVGRMHATMAYASDSRIAIEPFDVSYRLELETLWLTRE